MKIEVTGSGPLEVEASVLAVPVFEGDPADPKGLFAEIDRRLDGHLAAAVAEEEFQGKAGQSLSLRTMGKLRADRLLLVGLGKRNGAETALPRAGFEPLRLAAGDAARQAQKSGARRLAFAAPRFPGQTALEARAIVEGALLGAYRFDRYKTEEKKKKPRLIESLVVAVPQGLERSREVKDAVALARTVAASVAWARDRVNEPPLHLTPSRLADAARELAREAGLHVEVLGPREIAGLRMGMFLGVTRGSAEEPRLVKISWLPKGAAARKAPVVIVGKAITFDSGGLSLKPTEGMVDMKTDMAGAAAAIAAMRVVAELAPPFPVHALVGACENMPGGRAYKPSDILIARNGKTVEITNTDAEGRLVLGDVLAWGVETLKPALLVDLATLTGACIVALGMTTVGAFGPDGPAIDAVLAAARAAGEDTWRLPLTESVKEELKSDVADLEERRHAAGRLHQRRLVPQGVRRRFTLGAPGHRRPVQHHQGAGLHRPRAAPGWASARSSSWSGRGSRTRGGRRAAEPGRPRMTAVEELALLLRPAGGGVHLVSSGRDAQAAAQRRLHHARTDEEVQARFLARLARIGSARAVLLGVPSDVGAGYLRGANQGPLALRTRLLDEDPDWLAGAEARGLLDLGDVFVVPQLLHDDMLSPAQLRASRRALYPGLPPGGGGAAAGLSALHRRAGPRPRPLAEPGRGAGAARGRPLHRLAGRGGAPPGPSRVRRGAGRRPHRPARGKTRSEILLRDLVVPRQRAAGAGRTDGPGGDPGVAPRSLPLGVDAGGAPDLGGGGADRPGRRARRGGGRGPGVGRGRGLPLERRRRHRRGLGRRHGNAGEGRAPS